MNIIETEDLTKKFGDLTAVDRLNISVDEGEIFGLVGPDGAGKTTTIRLLATILEITDGSANIDGFDVRRQSAEVRRRIGYMSQRFTLYADLTVIENLDFFADLHGVPTAERRTRTEQLLNFSRLAGFADRRAGQLSGGMQQKLALACTLIPSPKLIFLDEPTTGVDPVSRREFWRILTILHREGKTLFVTTPYMDEADRCTRVAFMDNGKISICDSPVNIKKRIGGELIEVHSSDERRALEILRPLPDFRRSYIYGDMVQVSVDKAVIAIPLIRELLENAGLAVDSIHQVPPSMENAFIRLAAKSEPRDSGGKSEKSND